MKNFKTVTFVEKVENEENLKVTIIGACMQKDMVELAKKLSKNYRWVHIYNGAGVYDFSWNKKQGYVQWKAVEML